jgi:hypothetical protein
MQGGLNQRVQLFKAKFHATIKGHESAVQIVKHLESRWRLRKEHRRAPAKGFSII